MSLAQVHEDLETYISSADLGGISLTFENVEDSAYFLANSKFVGLSIEFLQATRLEVNPDPNKRENGLFTFDVYIPQGTGTREVYYFLDKLDVALLHKTRAGVYFQKRYKVGEYKIGKWQVYTYAYAFVFCN